MDEPNRFKFRAWDFSKEEMNTDPNPNEFVSINENFEGAEVDGWIYMQSTGLLDKNGKEIFEGDVVYLLDMPELPMAVQWDERLMEWGLSLTGEPMGRRQLRYDTAYKYTYMGNIYENPELLNPTKND